MFVTHANENNPTGTIHDIYYETTNITTTNNSINNMHNSNKDINFLKKVIVPYNKKQQYNHPPNSDIVTIKTPEIPPVNTNFIHGVSYSAQRNIEVDIAAVIINKCITNPVTLYVFRSNGVSNMNVA